MAGAWKKISLETDLHAAVTLSVGADGNLLSLSGQELGLDTQAANKVFAGRAAAGAAVVPAFRALVAADIPALSYAPVGPYLLSSGATALTGAWVQSGVYAIRTAGYMRVGNSAAPTNVTAGDLTASRMLLGTDGAIAGGSILDLEVTKTDTAAGQKFVLNIVMTVSPAGASSAGFRAVNVQPVFNSTFSQTDIAIFSFNNTVLNTGQITNSRIMYGSVVETYSVANINIAAADGISLTMFGRDANANVFTCTNLRGHVIDVGYGWRAADAVTNIIGVSIGNLGGVGRTNAFGIDIAAQSGAATLNYALRSGGPNKLAGNIGFYGTEPQAKQTVTGLKGGNAALGSLLTALSTLGLITDSSGV